MPPVKEAAYAFLAWLQLHPTGLFKVNRQEFLTHLQKVRGLSAARARAQALALTGPLLCCRHSPAWTPMHQRRNFQVQGWRFQPTTDKVCQFRLILGQIGLKVFGDWYIDWKDWLIVWQTYRQKQKDRQRDRQTGRQADRQTDRQKRQWGHPTGR